MATTTILLREDIETLGGRGEILKVKAGYARNYLIPQGLAILATKGNIRHIEQERTVLLKKASEEKATAELQAGQMANITLEFERLAGETGTLFGSVTSMDITAAIIAKGYELDRRKVILKDPIKELGDFTVNVKLHREVVLEIPVTVKAEGGEVKVEKTAKTEKSEPAVKESSEVPADSDPLDAAPETEVQIASEGEEE